MRCLVTGATGFVGAHLVQWLVKHDYRVGILVRPSSNLWRLQNVVDRVQVISGDLFTLVQVIRSIEEFAPDIVFHLGWSMVDNSSRNAPSQIQNLYSSLDLLHVSHRCGCQRWIGLGSQAEYGCHTHIISEDTNTHPNTLYGVVKLATALITQRLCEIYGIPFVWLRLFATYGPMDNQHTLVSYLIRTLLDGTKPILTKGEQQWDYLFVEDAVDAIGKIGVTSVAQGIFNLGAGQIIAIRYIAERIRDLIDPLLPLGLGERKYSPDQPMLLQADISRLKRAICWTPKISIDEGLQRTVEWYRQHRMN